jgi:hypothetical protein
LPGSPAAITSGTALVNGGLQPLGLVHIAVLARAHMHLHSSEYRGWRLSHRFDERAHCKALGTRRKAQPREQFVKVHRLERRAAPFIGVQQHLWREGDSAVGVERNARTNGRITTHRRADGHHARRRKPVDFGTQPGHHRFERVARRRVAKRAVAQPTAVPRARRVPHKERVARACLGARAHKLVRRHATAVPASYVLLQPTKGDHHRLAAVGAIVHVVAQHGRTALAPHPHLLVQCRTQASLVTILHEPIEALLHPLVERGLTWYGCLQ